MEVVGLWTGVVGSGDCARKAGLQLEDTHTFELSSVVVNCEAEKCWGHHKTDQVDHGCCRSEVMSVLRVNPFEA